MYPPEFDYRRPADLDDALSLLDDPAAVPLAGGHSLVPDLKTREVSPGTLVDLGDIDALRGVEVGDDDVAVGALTTYADFLEAAPPGVDALTDATQAVGDRQIRNRGTVGGNLAAADPTGDLPAAAVVSNATLTIEGVEGARYVDAGEFFHGDGETACDGDELLTEVRLPRGASAGSTGGAYAKKTHPASGYAAVGVAARIEVADGVVADARLAVNGVFDRPRRLTAVEAAVDGREASVLLDGDVDAAASHAGDDLDPGATAGDYLLSGPYRFDLLPRYTERALSRALARATDEPVADGEVVA